MYVKTSELRDLDVINLTDGRYLGNVCDVDLDPETGQLRSLIVDSPRGFFHVIGYRDDIEIPWEQVKVIGQDAIIVDLDTKQRAGFRSWRR